MSGVDTALYDDRDTPLGYYSHSLDLTYDPLLETKFRSMDTKGSSLQSSNKLAAHPTVLR
jgi:hypothetical protein